jgi:hypothetical protein
MGFKGTKADPDVYICAQVKPDGFEYYEMLLIALPMSMISYVCLTILNLSWMRLESYIQ